GDRTLLLRSLRSVLRPTLAAVLHADRIQRATHDVIAHSRQILDTPAANQHHRVLLQVVADARNIRGDFDAIGEPYASDLAQGRVRLLGRRRVNARADTALLRRTLEGRRALLRTHANSPLLHQLLNRRHPVFAFSSDAQVKPAS